MTEGGVKVKEKGERDGKRERETDREKGRGRGGINSSTRKKEWLEDRMQCESWSKHYLGGNKGRFAPVYLKIE